MWTSLQSKGRALTVTQLEPECHNVVTTLLSVMRLRLGFLIINSFSLGDVLNAFVIVMLFLLQAEFHMLHFFTWTNFVTYIQ
jgi:hypothetical protein